MTRTRMILGTLVLGVLLSACSSTTPIAAPTATSDQPVPSVAVAAATCVDGATFNVARDGAVKYLNAAIHATSSFDTQTAATKLRLAAVDVRTMADITGDIAPDITAHLQRSADDLDKAAVAMEDLQIEEATSWMTAGTHEIALAVGLQTPDTYC